MEFLRSRSDLTNFTLYDTAVANCGTGRKFRPDVLYVLSDRYVILEIDEHEHKYYCAVAEFDRLQEIRDELGEHESGKYCVVVRFNPNQPHREVDEMHAELERMLRDAFVTGDVVNAETGVLTRYLGYSSKRLGEIIRDVKMRTTAEFESAKRASVAQ